MGDLKNYYKGRPDVSITGYIHQTSNYDLFHFIEGNRDIEKIDNLKKSMLKHGYIGSPIVINERGEVIDGQHRLTACKETNIPVQFIVRNGIGINEISDLNIGQLNWKPKNYLHLDSVQGINESKRFEQLVEMFPYRFNVIYAAMGNGITGGNATKAIKNHAIVCDEGQYEEAVKTCMWLSAFDDFIKSKKMRGSVSNFQLAVIFAKRCNSVDPTTLVKRVKDNFHIFGNRFGSVEDEVENVEKAYNFKIAINNRVYLLDQYKKAAAKNSSRSKKGIGNESNAQSGGINTTQK